MIVKYIFEDDDIGFKLEHKHRASLFLILKLQSLFKFFPYAIFSFGTFLRMILSKLMRNYLM